MRELIHWLSVNEREIVFTIGLLVFVIVALAYIGDVRISGSK